MSGSSQILKEFLVAIGFDVDEFQLRTLATKMDVLLKSFAKLGTVAASAGIAISATILETASSMEKLYFQSQLAGTSAKELSAIKFGGEQAGVGAEQMAGAVERMASAIRSNPGLVSFFKATGAKFDPNDFGADFLNLLTKLHGMDQKGGGVMARLIGQQFGIDETTLTQIFANWNDFSSGIQQQLQTLNKAGITDEDFKKSHEADENWRKFKADLDALTIDFEKNLLPDLDAMVNDLKWLVDEMVKLDKATKGWSTTIAGIAIAGGGAATAGAVLRGIGATVSGGVGGAAAGAGIASTAATTGLAGADIALGIHDFLGAQELYKAYKNSGINPLKGLLQDSMTVLKDNVSIKDSVGKRNVIDPIARFIASREGNVGKFYRDIGGHLTTGFGHLVRPGENLSGSDAVKLLLQDVHNAMLSVQKLVKVPLNQNQLTALVDFVYNLGPGALAKSSLLKFLNAGDYADAADQFGRFNKVLENGHYVTSESLTNRRLGERSLFLKPDVNINQKTDIHVAGGSDPKATGKAVADQQRTVNGDIVRNMQGAVQ